jgi:hypothetical protein
MEWINNIRINFSAGDQEWMNHVSTESKINFASHLYRKRLFQVEALFSALSAVKIMPNKMGSKFI